MPRGYNKDNQAAIHQAQRTAKQARQSGDLVAYNKYGSKARKLAEEEEKNLRAKAKSDAMRPKSFASQLKRTRKVNK